MAKFLLLLMVASFADAVGQIPKKTDAPNNIEIVLNTDGDLRLDGSPAGAVTTNKAQNLTNDKLVKQFSVAEETKVFTTKTEAKNGKKHEPLAIAIPDGSLVTLRTQTGNVTLDNVKATVSGYLQSGNLVLNNLKGEVELISEKGDITATSVEARGMLIARNGNIQLTDVMGLVTTYAPQGKISLTIGKDYYKKSPKPLDISLTEGEIEIAAAPYGGKVQLGKGMLTISDISQPLVVDAEAADITLRGVAAPLTLRNRGNVGVQLVKFADKKNEIQTVDIETRDGDVTLELATNFAGSLEIWTSETNPTGEKAPVTSIVPLGQAIVADIGYIEGKVPVRETTYGVIVGKGSGPKVAVHITNGKVIIKN